MSRKKLSRRQFVAATALSSAALITAPYVRGAHAAGKLSWASGITGCPAPTRPHRSVNEWAAKEKVEVSIDYITEPGQQEQADHRGGSAGEIRPRHSGDADMVAARAMQNSSSRSTTSCEPLIKQNGAVNGTVEYLGKLDGKWLGVPAAIGSQIKGPCSRIDLMKKYAGIDVQANVSGRQPAKADNWTLDTFLKAAEACHKGGFPFGIGLGETTDSVDTVGALFHSFGAELVDAKGNVTVKTDEVRQALEYLQEADGIPAAGRVGLGRRLQQQVADFRQGRADHEPAERLGGRQARQSAGRRAMLDPWLPGRTEGPLRAVTCRISGRIWKFSKNKAAAKSLLVHLSQPASIAKLVQASGGYDLPAFKKLTTLEDLGRGGPPKGTVYHYPNPYNHQTLSIAASPAPPKIAPADLHPGDPDQDVRAPLPGRSDGKDAGLGRRRAAKASCAAEAHGRSRQRADAHRAGRGGRIGTSTDGRGRSAASRPRTKHARMMLMVDVAFSRQRWCSAAARKRCESARRAQAQIDHRVPDDACR